MTARQLINELIKTNRVFNSLIVKCDDTNKEVVKWTIDHQFLVITTK